ncbi:hypothetical protein MUK70_01550 [Dyadobacter chenwenxiniae]|uniref:Uncharacterized protein n=1 Tax=Dyadobacter chenwenxiniae TaxID=2906456 RepID=A0A9X1PN10_9BACT|nr:hypothetical protein [Dyadobacter chenwenxiniae]MCF0062568.1 hypothetical protein [Dyadobacter chenwenxiniae]UON83688.1 hypothetical protein MUK70_01550 [Dyadobacter chenwenxiniae]
MDNNQLRTVYRAISLICYFTFAILLNVSCKNKNIGLDNVEQVKQDSTGPIRQDTVLTVGRGGIYYNDDIVSTPPKEIVYKFTKYYTRVDTILYPTNFIYTIGVFGYYPFLKYRVSPTNNTPIYAIVDLGSMLPIKQKWEYVATYRANERGPNKARRKENRAVSYCRKDPMTTLVATSRSHSNCCKTCMTFPAQIE